MNSISKHNKDRIIEFINSSELDYDMFETDISQFRLTSYDGMEFSIYEDSQEFIVVKFDPNKGKEQIYNPGVQAHQYFKFKTLPQILEQFKTYDDSLFKTRWSIIKDSVTEEFNQSNYKDDWFNILDSDQFQLVYSDKYKYLIYSNESIKPKLVSPLNTLHETSPINKRELTEVNKLYLEIHPISCQERKEMYFVKILSNNEDILKEYLNFRVIGRKGLRLFLESILKEVGLDKF